MRLHLISNILILLPEPIFTFPRYFDNTLFANDKLKYAAVLLKIIVTFG